MKTRQKKVSLHKNTGIKLGVNLDHTATLRQVRGTLYPELSKMVELACEGGADQITLHLREDRRHIQDRDVEWFVQERPCSFNFEIAATKEMVGKALRLVPNWVCLVPEKREELTTEGGLDVAAHVERLKGICGQLKEKGIAVSLFVDPVLKQVRAAHKVGAEACEFHTGDYATCSYGERPKEFQKLEKSAKLANQMGLRVHAGHGLTYSSAKSLCLLPYLVELNIGHFLVCEALKVGLKEAVAKMKCLISS